MKTYLFYYLGYCILINCGETSYSKESPNLLIVKVKESLYDHFGRWSWLDAKIVKNETKKEAKAILMIRARTMSMAIVNCAEDPVTTRLIVGKTTAMRQNVHQGTKPTKTNARRATTKISRCLNSLHSR